MSNPSAAHVEPAARVLRLKRGEERRLAAGHVWVFSNEIDTGSTPLTAFAPGAVAQVRTQRDTFVGYACVNPHALICARILSREEARPVDGALIERRLRAALALRERLTGAPYYRWVFGESDQLPGLVLDRYGAVVVGQIATAGMEALREEVAAAVRAVLAPAVLYWKNDSAARELEHLPRFTAAAFGAVPANIEVTEGGLSFTAPLAEGQKTGWFYDQSANRARLARYVAAGARVLDVCSYVGAWAVTALRHGAARAQCVDTSQAALEFAQLNAARNGTALQVLRADAFEALKSLTEQGERFDLVILDPPAFIKRKKDTPKGQAAYRKLNQLALGLLADEGLLVSCSCSYHLAPEELVSAIQSAARHSGRFVQILEAGGQSPDHPVHPAIPETRYLKAFFCRVTREVG
ncbi:MAG: class I SAM-dependent rRNA methyltransferase [Gammaproteobacteria bacterium]|nr:MAG: class I SAM-dependent rRNA methyltransferase [Gammaproteobacteria bacterium]TLZ21490.1 MAG: class I SAM-dependent rRNA methyltransferase [Gammaproteobacteria bacterium]TLZ47639.1 MAG: class I SAM-dependent rRNA methyltransferase [Gammaproteobacteria bacterium]